MTAVRINEWSVGSIGGDAYTPPECRESRVQGLVQGHPTKKDGTFIITSPVRRTEGRRFWTRTGTEYELGEPAADYLNYLKRIGRTYDAEHPLPVVGAPKKKRPSLRVVR